MAEQLKHKDVVYYIDRAGVLSVRGPAVLLVPGRDVFYVDNELCDACDIFHTYEEAQAACHQSRQRLLEANRKFADETRSKIAALQGRLEVLDRDARALEEVIAREAK